MLLILWYNFYRAASTLLLFTEIHNKGRNMFLSIDDTSATLYEHKIMPFDILFYYL